MLWTSLASAQPAPAPQPDVKPAPAPAAAPAPKKMSDPTTGPDPFKSPAVDVAQTAPPVVPPPPPPWATAPTSTTGTQLLPPGATTPAATDVPVEQRLADLEARLKAAEDAAEKNEEKMGWLRHIKISGYVQGQLLIQRSNAAGSANLGTNGQLPAGVGSNDIIAKADGTTTNGDFFRLRRARAKFELMPTEYAKLVMEIDPIPQGGTIARQAEAIGIAKWSHDCTTEFGVGLYKPQFGYYLPSSDADTYFIEKSAFIGNMFPGERDIGARSSTSLLTKKLNIHLALTNGYMTGEKNFALSTDLNRGKDFWGRLNYNFGPFDVGFSATYGQGQNVDPVALKFKQFPRWAVDFEANVHHTFAKALGETRFYGELVLGKNEDRGLRYAFALPAIPSDAVNGTVQDLDERGLSLRLEQELSKLFFAGARYDFYSPDTAQKNNQRDTYSFVGGVHFTKGLDLRLEYDYAIDNVHKPNAPAPRRQFHTFSTSLQARF
jgi:hypothetical protein